MNIDLLYQNILEKLDKEIDKRIEEKITEILYTPILKDSKWKNK